MRVRFVWGFMGSTSRGFADIETAAMLRMKSWCLLSALAASASAFTIRANECSRHRISLRRGADAWAAARAGKAAPQPSVAEAFDATELAAEAAAAAAVAVLRSTNADINDATVARTVSGVSAKVRELLQSETGRVPPQPQQQGQPPQYGQPPQPQYGAPPLSPQQQQQQQQQPPPQGTYGAAPPPPAAYGAPPPPVMPASYQQPPAQQAQNVAAGEPNGLDRETVRRVLTEFINSDYGKRLCDDCRVQPMIGSPNIVGAMFESAQITDARLVVKLKQVFEIRHERILEQLVPHLKARMPQLRMLQYENKSPPSTRTIPL